MNAPARQLQDARQLHRLRELRERQALNALRQAESQVAAAEHAVAERQRAMDRLQQQRDALSQRIVGDCAARMGRLAAYASATQEDLDDQLERTEYALIDDEDALSEAREQAAQARAAWLRTVAQRDAAHTLVGDARKAVLRERDTRLDREDPPARAARGSLPGLYSPTCSRKRISSCLAIRARTRRAASWCSRLVTRLNTRLALASTSMAG